MTYRMTGREDDSYSPITKEVIGIGARSIQEIPIQSYHVKIAPGKRICRKPVWGESVFQLSALNNMNSVGEPAYRAGVIPVQM